MTGKAVHNGLIDLIDKKAFNVIIKASPDD